MQKLYYKKKIFTYIETEIGIDTPPPAPSPIYLLLNEQKEMPPRPCFTYIMYIRVCTLYIYFHLFADELVTLK